MAASVRLNDNSNASLETLAAAVIELQGLLDFFSVNESGHLLVTGLPTSDPSVSGEVYTSTGAVKVSA